MVNRWQWLILISSLTGCQAADVKSKATPDDLARPALSASMQNLKMTLERILPKAVDSKVFNDPKNRTELGQELQLLNDLAGRVSHNPVREKMDPSFAFLSEGFSSEIARANEAFAINRAEYARYKLLNVTSYCIECHTRVAAGPSFGRQDQTGHLSSLTPLERGEYFLATRQFDAALAEFQKLLNTDDDRYQYIQFDRALRYSLAITVRFQNDPAKTELVIQKMQKSRQLPYYLKQASQAWQKDVQAWRSENRKNRQPAIADQLVLAESLIESGRKRQTSESERSGDVALLRGLSILHQILAGHPNKAELGQALFLTGSAYEAVRDVVTWSLQESYFESCVRRVPHTSWSQKCYKALEETVSNGFTGSSGTRIPYDVKVRLAELEKLAGAEVPTH